MIEQWMKPKIWTQIMFAISLILVFIMLVLNIFLSTETQHRSKLAEGNKTASKISETNEHFAEALKFNESSVQQPDDEEVHLSRKMKRMAQKGQRSQSLVSVETKTKTEKGKSQLGSTPPMFAGYRIVHIDLKGAPVSMNYFKEFFPLLRTLGATGLLLEYEDMFPYSGPLIDFRTTRHAPLSKSEVKELLRLAEENDLEVIPLIQTFAHMEFILKQQEYAEMRESPKFRQSICPTHNKTFGLITEMVDQVMELHPSIRYLHIGCDEVRQLGMCHSCVTRKFENHWTDGDLFLYHVTRTAKYVKQHYPNVSPLIWDDHLRKSDESQLRSWKLAELVEPVIWMYTPRVVTGIRAKVWNKYANIFPAVWIASAFKGATGVTQYITDISFHLANHHAWMSVVAKYKDRLAFKGIVITGWQRYSHFEKLCELLPVAIPSLAVNLAYLQTPFNGSVLDMPKSAPPSVVEALHCNETFALTPQAQIQCDFPGAAVLQAAKELYAFQRSINKLNTAFSSEEDILQRCSAIQTWAYRENRGLSDWPFDADKVMRDMGNAMVGIYDDFTREEWINGSWDHINKWQKELRGGSKTLALCKAQWGKIHNMQNTAATDSDSAIHIRIVLLLCGLLKQYVFGF